MAQFSEADSAKAARLFFRNEVRNMDAATYSATRAAAEGVKREVKKQLRKFKRSRGSSFARAVKVYNLKAKGSMGPASFVRLGVPFMDVFQEGKTVSGKRGNLIILLDPGKKLGFKRVSKGNTWQRVWERIRDRAFFSRVNDGVVVVYTADDGRTYPIYKFQQQVKVPKKISFLELAEEYASEVPEEIRRLMENQNY